MPTQVEMPFWKAESQVYLFIFISSLLGEPEPQSHTDPDPGQPDQLGFGSTSLPSRFLVICPAKCGLMIRIMPFVMAYVVARSVEIFRQCESFLLIRARLPVTYLCNDFFREYTQCQAFCPFVGIGSPHPFPLKRMLLHPSFGSTFACGGWGVGGTQRDRHWYYLYTIGNPSTFSRNEISRAILIAFLSAAVEILLLR